ncbi:hypothetical protein [Bacillus cereus]|uniref:hypothetical protein n=1 Tax=Bacillus cereus TaxID=1396 RepID=UPI000BFB8443|nr:hypothetical protein [Bacillus cereus]PGT15165.1 hypothetical protein COC96_19920 [Bacillus cereus]
MTLIFDREYLKSLFVGDKEKRIRRVEESLRRVYEYSVNRQEGNVKSQKRILQADKDETIITLYTFAAIHKSKNDGWNDILTKCFPSESWNIHNTNLRLEQAISPSKNMQDRLRGQALSNPVKYLREQCNSEKRVEGKTNFDALLEVNTDKKIFFECKYTSDISYQTTYVTERNQIARCIEVGLEAVNYNVENFYFILVTPERYRKFPGSRLYYFKMKQYQNDPKALAMDLPTLTERFGDNECHEILVKIMKHICWLTWEDCFKTTQQMKHLTPLQFDSLKAFYSDRNILPF